MKTTAHKVYNISILLFLKPIVDMFWQFKILDVLLGIYVLGCLWVYRRRLQIEWQDVCIAAFVVMWTISFFRAPGAGALAMLTKILSSFFLFYLGRICTENIEKCIYVLQVSLKIVFMVNVIVVLVGAGTSIWGYATTQTGMYYFKLDFAYMLIQFLIFHLTKDKYKPYEYVMIIASFVLIFMSNSRIMFGISCIWIFLRLLYCREYSQLKEGKGRPCKINAVFLLGIMLSIVASVLLQAGLCHLPFSENKKYITFTIDGKEYKDVDKEYYDLIFTKEKKSMPAHDIVAYNTQGRADIWKAVLQKYTEKNIWEKIFGSNLLVDEVVIILKQGKLEADAHNLFLKNLVCTGIVGLIVTFAFIFSFIPRYNHCENRDLFYVGGALFLTFLLTGMISNVQLYSQFTWLTFFFLGLLMENSESGMALGTRGTGG